MKIKELIEKLKRLDQEKELYILYDGFLFIEPQPIEYEPSEYERSEEGICDCYIIEAN